MTTTIFDELSLADRDANTSVGLAPKLPPSNAAMDNPPRACVWVVPSFRGASTRHAVPFTLTSLFSTLF